MANCITVLEGLIKRRRNTTAKTIYDTFKNIICSCYGKPVGETSLLEQKVEDDYMVHLIYTHQSNKHSKYYNTVSILPSNISNHIYMWYDKKYIYDML